MIAIIPARGGSKGLPKKNIKEINGKPLIAWTIESALKAESIHSVLVTTDDEEIAKVAKEFGAKVPFIRPEELASDSSQAVDVYNHAINFINEEQGEKLEEVVVLLPTCPLRNSSDIDAAIDLFVEKKADSVISYTQEGHPINWHKYLNKNHQFEDIFKKNELSNRQDLRISYYPNGAIYIFKTSLLENRIYYTDNSYAYVMPKSRSVDIDDEDDFLYAEFLMEKRKK